jgi:predicted nucleic acid-binding protein
MDSSAIWRIQRDPAVGERWRASIEAGELRSCEPQRIEFRRSSRNLDEFEQMSADLTTFYPDISVPKGVWRWIEAAQLVLVREGALRAFSLVDLLVCGAAAAHGLTVLHDDHDFEVAARHLTDVHARRVAS